MDAALEFTDSLDSSLEALQVSTTDANPVSIQTFEQIKNERSWKLASLIQENEILKTTPTILIESRLYPHAPTALVNMKDILSDPSFGDFYLAVINMLPNTDDQHETHLSSRSIEDTFLMHQIASAVAAKDFVAQNAQIPQDGRIMFLQLRDHFYPALGLMNAVIGQVRKQKQIVQEATRMTLSGEIYTQTVERLIPVLRMLTGGADKTWMHAISYPTKLESLPPMDDQLKYGLNIAKSVAKQIRTA